MNKRCLNIILNFKDFKKSYKTIKRSFSSRKRDNFNKKNKKRPNKTILRLFYQIKDLQEVDLT
jgi:hypothetical protein